MAYILHRAYKFRIYPDKKQTAALASAFGCVRLVYNHFLSRKSEYYKQTGKNLTYTQCAAELTALKKEKPFLKETDSIALQQALRHLDTAFQNFFRNPAFGYPKFKSKKAHRDSYSTVCVNGNIRLEGNRIVLPKTGKVRIKCHRAAPENAVLKSATVSRTPSGQFYVSLLYEYTDESCKTTTCDACGERVLGLDFSASDMFVSSDENVTASPEFLHRYKKAQKKLRKEQKTLSRRQKGGKNREKQRRKVAKCHQHIANQRLDYLHKLSRQIANEWDMVCIEDLDLKEMSGHLHLGKSIGDDGWGMFTTLLSYKLEECGKALVRVDKWFPSSQICHCCGYQYRQLQLEERTWTCPSCRTVHDRDKNAALNILQEGQRIRKENCA